MTINKKYKYVAIAIVVCAIVAFVCVKLFSKKDNPPLIVSTTLGGKTPENYYKDLAEQSHCMNLDSLYISTIMILCDSCNYDDMLTFLPQLRNTPAYEYAIAKYIIKRDMLIDSIEYAMSTYIDTVKSQFVEDIIPILLQEVNDDLVEQVLKALEKYEEDGFVGIVRDTTTTLGFRFKDTIDLDNAWNEFVGNRYTKILNGYVREYTDNIAEYFKGCGKTSDYEPYNFNVYDFTLVKPSEVLAKYSEEQNKQMIKDLAIDGGMLILSIATSGTAAIIVEVVDLAYNSYQIYNEFNEEEQTETDKLIISIAEFVDIQIENYLHKNFNNYVDNEHKRIMESVLNQMEKNELSLNLKDEDNISPITKLKVSLLNELSQTN